MVKQTWCDWRRRELREREHRQVVEPVVDLPKGRHICQFQKERRGKEIQFYRQIESARAHRVSWLGRVPREQKMLKGYLPKVIHHQGYQSK